MKKRTFHETFWHLIKFTSYFFSILAFFYIVFANVINLIAPDQTFIDPRVFRTEYLRFLVMLGLILGLLGWLITFLQKRIAFVSPVKVPVEEAVAYTCTALLFAFFYKNSFLSIRFTEPIVFLLIFLLFFFGLPQLIHYYMHFSYHHVARKKEPKEYAWVLSERIIPNVFLILIASLTVLFSLLIFFNVVYTYVSGKIEYRRNLERTLYIKSITPDITTHAEKAILEGYNFGWKETDAYKLKSDRDFIPTEEWTDTKIIFTVPLHMREGLNTVWVERPDLNNKPGIIKSNHATITVIDRFKFFPAENDPKPLRGLKKIFRTVFFKVTAIKLPFL